MDKHSIKKLKEEDRLETEKRKMKAICPYCGVRIHFYAFENKNKQLCVNCNRYVFRNKKEAFKYRSKEKILRKKRGIK